MKRSPEQLHANEVAKLRRELAAANELTQRLKTGLCESLTELHNMCPNAMTKRDLNEIIKGVKAL